MKSPLNTQLNLPPSLLTDCSQGAAARTNSSHDADVLAAQVFDEALTASNISTKEAAHLLGVSESLVNRMRSANYREGVSLSQLLRLPPAFHLALHRSMNRRFGFGRQLLARLLDDVGDLALAVER